MNFEMKLRLERRKGDKKNTFIAPFINDWNVWDIPEKQWTPAVASAIQNAYLLGRNQTIATIKKELAVKYTSPTCDWGDVEDET